MNEQTLKETAKEIAERYVKPMDFKSKPKICSYPLCDEIANTEYHRMFLCDEHLELAKFIKWFYYKLGLS